ncbi:MAG: hypothetical protein IPK64_05220 [bacterium]|nr:hypothetical protein [bacterium]
MEPEDDIPETGPGGSAAAAGDELLAMAAGLGAEMERELAHWRGAPLPGLPEPIRRLEGEGLL